jgi:DNA-binding response OmpR family regulator
MAICGGPDPVEVAEVDDAAAALDLMTRDGAAVVMLEIQIDGALALITTLRDRYPELVIVACSFQADAATQELALGAGADSFLKKPMSSRELYRALVKTPD